MFRARRAVLLVSAVVAVTAAGCGAETEQPAAGAPTPETNTPAAPTSSAPTRQSPPPQPPPDRPEEIVRLSYGNGRISGDTGRVEIPLGSTVALVVTGATADEVHVHGYDLTLEVPAKNTARLIFTADIPGVFEVELHDAGKTLTRLAVRPE